MHEMYSFLSKEIGKGYNQETIINNYSKILITINPIIPHFSNECLELLEITGDIIWPSYDEKFLEETNVNIVIQINGKKRGLIKIDKDTSEQTILEHVCNDKNLIKYIEKNKIKKQIYIKNKLMNLIL